MILMTVLAKIRLEDVWKQSFCKRRCFCCRVRFVWQGGNSSFNLSPPCKLRRLLAVSALPDVLPRFWRSLGGELLIVDSHFLPLPPTLRWYRRWLQPRPTSKLASASVFLGGGGVTTRTLINALINPLSFLAVSPSLTFLLLSVGLQLFVRRREDGTLSSSAQWRPACQPLPSKAFSSINPTPPEGWKAAFKTRWKTLVLFAAVQFDLKFCKT